MSSRSFRGGGRGGFGNTLSFGLPPFTPAVKWLVIANTVVYLAMLLVGAAAPTLAAYITAFAYLRPILVVHGWVWQLVTYSFFHFGLFHILFNMITLWMFGSLLETGWGYRRFMELYFFCAVMAALTTVGVSYLGTVPVFSFLGIGPVTPTLGASGAIYGVMVAFAVLYGDQEFMLFPLPFTVKAKYLVIIFILISLAGALQPTRGESVAYFAHLGGALFGYLYVKFLPRHGLMLGASDRYFGWRNAYYRWKRRRAARKFEVYMRKYDRDKDQSQQHLDDSYSDPKKGNGGTRPPWVN